MLFSILLLLVPFAAVAQDACEGNFDCDTDVDGTDASVFKSDFGRSGFKNPCPTSSDCCSGSLSPLGRWCDQFNGTVKDMTTGLVWLKDAGWGGTKAWREEGDYTHNDDAHTRAGILYAGMSGAGLSDGSVEGDWRLPTLTELVGITVGDEYIRSSQLYFFTNVQPWFYWSSTTYASSTRYAWDVTMSPVYVSYDSKYNSSGYVWPVRGGH